MDSETQKVIPPKLETVKLIMSVPVASSDRNDNKGRTSGMNNVLFLGLGAD